MLEVIQRRIDAHPRSQQKRIGPSEIGATCSRRLGYKLAGVEPVRDTSGWLPTIGTAVHTFVESALHAENARLGRDRFIIERYVELPQMRPMRLRGRLDCYDTDTDSVIDWKIVGKTTLDEARRGRIKAEYAVQIQTYAMGIREQGFEPKACVIAFLPRNEIKLDKAVFHVEPFNEAIAGAAMDRVMSIQTAIDVLGVDALPRLPITDDPKDCNYCPFFRPTSQDATTACPGVVDVTDVQALLSGPANPSPKKKAS